jgi:hypothetical protein
MVCGSYERTFTAVMRKSSFGALGIRIVGPMINYILTIEAQLGMFRVSLVFV